MSGQIAEALGREVFPDMTRDRLWMVLWNATGWPGFFRDDPQAELRAQLAEAWERWVCGEPIEPSYP